ncbi:hypothetical protein PUR28_18395 [Streptomyces sp. BE308]|uniref:hypothetical protein n=1 Tax=Streptomyces sp. BE308 TaxID=3002529 RepID=UPI002E77A2CB|nr:hypothetical protein [Streptomyces sp. BE308]MEE1792713.1 hypothetical protein [Streptomyces sp. BE308]
MSEGTTGVVAVDTAVVWSVAAAAIVAGLGLLWQMTRGVRRILGRVDEFVDDWQGVPPRPGVSGRPGVMARLDGIEERLGRVEHELHPNSGGSLRDAVDRVDVRTRQIAADASE